MKCDLCKISEATIHIQEVINNNIKTIHICEDCAKSYGIKNNIFEMGFNLFDLFAKINGEKKDDIELKENPVKEHKSGIDDENIIKCPLCGISYDEFLESGKLGCGYCYTSFREQIKPILRRIHGCIYHKGKVPVKYKKRIKIVKDLKVLNNRLRMALKKEDYEEAAFLRDKIKKISTQTEE
ncbi:MAG: UvrB/UvrC motif-containing protein [bacterium]|nr:UvrB/UvrC motif-containing protein [bacterium]